MSIAESESLASDPLGFFGHSHRAMLTIDRHQLEELHLDGIRFRLEQQRAKLPALGKLIEVAGISSIAAINDVVPLLFEHTVYKSYPVSLLEQHRFDALTRWLSRLTLLPLDHVDASQCGSIDDWLDLLDRETELCVCHSSGTTGTMSFLPISKSEMDMYGQLFPILYFQDFAADGDAGPFNHVDVVYPFYRSGCGSQLRMNDRYVRYLAGSEERFHALYPSRISADVLFLAGKIRAAKAAGRLDQLNISPAIARRQQEFETQQSDQSSQIEKFFERITADLAGKKVFMAAPWNMIYPVAKRGLEQGLNAVFHPESVILTGGGAKGLVIPDDWKETIQAFTGARSIAMAYGMSEAMGNHRMCELGRYHMVPWIVPFVLDPATGKPFPRTGTSTGRAAFFDLTAGSHWGGFASGDKVTIHWDEPCPCGRTTPYFEYPVERLSDTQGGDDKITCAATADAHEAALEFITQRAN